MHISRALNGSSAIQRFEGTIEVHDRIILRFLHGTATHVCSGGHYSSIVYQKSPRILIGAHFMFYIRTRLEAKGGHV